MSEVVWDDVLCVGDFQGVCTLQVWVHEEVCVYLNFCEVCGI